jgi:hypothetical protein
MTFRNKRAPKKRSHISFKSNTFAKIKYTTVVAPVVYHRRQVVYFQIHSFVVKGIYNYAETVPYLEA